MSARISLDLSPDSAKRGSLCHRRRQGRAAVLLAIALAVPGCGRNKAAAARRDSADVRLLPDTARLEAAPDELRRHLAVSPLAMFRFVNQAWTHEVCEAFAADLPALPTVRLHGDAHIEQYAVTATARGLDDFDDSVRGASVVDIVRFLGSVELTTYERGWEKSNPAIVDSFFGGYRRALVEPTYLPDEPTIVTRLREKAIPTAAEYLDWVDRQMEPLAANDQETMNGAWHRVEAYAARSAPEFTAAFLKPKKMGRLRRGIGSALARKVLVRVEGPSPAPDDDVVLEAKEVLPLRPERCISLPSNAEVYRVVEGLALLGRLSNRFVIALPSTGESGSDARGWWIKVWDRTYRELEVADLASAEELREVALDVAAQLGSANLREAPEAVAAQKRLAELESLGRLEPRIREVTHMLSLDAIDAWREFKTASRR
jgi:uncharacterized protein (DUF2252 family)